MNYGLSGRYKVMVVNSRTKRVLRGDRRWHSNLIMNTGMEQIASDVICNLFTYARAGTGTTTGDEVSADYGTTATCDVAGNVALVGGTFKFDGIVPSDHNNIIKWSNTGYEGRITTIPSSATASTCTILPLPAVPQSGSFVMYRTNMTDLATHVVGTVNYLPSSPSCSSSVIGNMLVHQRTWDFPEETGTVNYTEMGVGWTASTTNTLFARFLLHSVTPVNAGEQLRLVYQLRVVVEPYDILAKTATVTNWPVLPSTTTAGNERIQLLGLSSVSSVGATTSYDAGGYANEPSRTATVSIFLSPVSTALAAFGSCVNRSASAASGAVTSPSYTAYSNTRIKQVTLTGNGASYYSMGVCWSTPAANTCTFVFSQPQTLALLYTLNLQYFFTWSRVLSASSV
jgi:hypothetical protein